MLSTRKRIAAAALLLLLSQENDFDSSSQSEEESSDEEAPPRHLCYQPPSPGEAAGEAKPSDQLILEEDDLNSLAAEVGEPIDQYLPSASHQEDDLSDVVVVEEGPMYVPPPSKIAKRSKRSSRVADVTEEYAEGTSDGAVGDREKKRKRFWTQKLYLQRERPPDHPLSEGIPYLDPTEELKILKMSEECFEILLNLVSPLIEKQSTTMRAAISPRQRLVAVLRYLVTAQSQETLKFSTLLSPSLMGSVLPETCQAIIQVLTPDYMKFPDKKEDWQKVAGEFSESCDFPNCGGSLNAKHVCIFKGVGTKHHVNHKGYSSVILATLVDANHRFLSAEVMLDERESDASAILKTEFYQKLFQDSLDLPDNGENEGRLDFVFVAPNSFPLHSRVLMTYPAKQLPNDTHARITYNEQIRSVNRHSENALGLMASRFGVFRTAINIQVWKIGLIVKACCAIHNFLSVEGRDEYISDTTYDHRDEAGNLILGGWRRDNFSDTSFSNLQTILRQEPFSEYGHNRKQYVEHFCSKVVERNLSLLL